MDKGYIKLSRKILQWEHFKEANVLKVFLALLLVANRETRQWKVYDCHRGETFISVKSLSELCGISDVTVYSCLKKLIASGEITRIRTQQSSSKTILNNYNFYQHEFKKNYTDNIKKVEYKQEDKNNKNNSSSLSINNNARTREAKVIADEMFSSGTIIEAFCKNEKVSMNQARQLCEEVLNEWELTKPQHVNETDVRKHLLSHMRKIIQSKNLVHEDKDKRLKKIIEDCKRLIKDGYPAKKVRQFYLHWTQPVNDNSGRMLFESVRAFDTITKFLTYYKNGR